MRNEALVTFAKTMEDFMKTGSAKLATLWFDVLHLELGSVLDSGLIAGAPSFEEWKQRTIYATEPDTSPDAMVEITSRWNYTSDDPEVQRDNSLLPDEILSAIEATVRVEADRSLALANPHPMEAEMEFNFAKTNLTRTFASWLQVSGDQALLGSQLESAVLKMLGPAKRSTSAHETFCEFITQTVPDFSALTWNNIADLRNHGNFADFRANVLELDERIAASDLNEAGALCRNVLQEQLMNLAKLVRPNVSRCTVRGLIGNFPLPLPVNPASAYFAAKDIAREKAMRDQFGSTYFLIDLHDMARATRR